MPSGGDRRPVFALDHDDRLVDQDGVRSFDLPARWGTLHFEEIEHSFGLIEVLRVFGLLPI
jgi:hypothetical protein